MHEHSHFFFKFSQFLCAESVILSAADDQQLLQMTLQYGIILVYLLESVLMQTKTF